MKKISKKKYVNMIYKRYISTLLNFTDKQIVTCPTCRHKYDLKHLV